MTIVRSQSSVGYAQVLGKRLKNLKAEGTSENTDTSLFLKEDLIAMQIRTTRSPAESGSNAFTLTLVPRRNYLQLIQPGDWVKLYLGNGSVSVKYMIGVVDFVSQSSRAGGNGQEETTVTVAGRDWSKVIANTETVFDAQIGGKLEGIYLMGEAAKWMNQANKVPLSPTEFISNLLPLYLGGSGPAGANLVRQFLPPVSLDGKNPVVGTFLDFSGVKATEGVAVITPGNQGGSLLRLLTSLSNQLMNEFWFDTNPGSDFIVSTKDAAGKSKMVFGHPFRVVLRPYPFSREDFLKLPAHVVESTECMNFSVGTSTSDVRNWYRIHTNLGNGGGADLATVARLGLIMPRSIERFGLRRFEEYSQFIFHDGQPAVDLIRKWNQKQVEWNWMNDQLLSGTIAMRLRPDIRVGNRLVYSDKYHGGGYSFYVDGVDHFYNYPGASVTVVKVSRGVRSTDYLLSYKQIQAKGLVVSLENPSLLSTVGVAAATASTPTPTPTPTEP